MSCAIALRDSATLPVADSCCGISLVDVTSSRISSSYSISLVLCASACEIDSLMTWSAACLSGSVIVSLAIEGRAAAV